MAWHAWCSHTRSGKRYLVARGWQILAAVRRSTFVGETGGIRDFVKQQPYLVHTCGRNTDIRAPDY